MSRVDDPDRNPALAAIPRQRSRASRAPAAKPVTSQVAAGVVDQALEMPLARRRGDSRPSLANPFDRGDGQHLSGRWRFLALLDITNFGMLRRVMGASRAESLVIDVAEIVSAQLPEARLSVIGRTMLELVFDGAGLADFDAALGSLAAAFVRPIDLDGAWHLVELSIGGAAAPTALSDDIRMAEEAEEAIREARLATHFVIRDLSVATPAFDRKTLVVDLRRAIAHQEFFLQYQPKVHLRRQEIASAEALIRWQHPARGLILPGDFIPAVEQSREIAALTLWTLERVIADQKMLAGQGHDLMLFINISGQLLGDAAFVARACQIVQSGGARIGFEITETSVIRDPQTAIAHLQVFADMGIDLAIDDYGAGLSSLAYLKQLPAKELKIDKMFVMQLTSSHRDPLIVRSTIDLAHALEMEVTAEGVETEAALALLSVMGCDMVQGYLLSRPISVEALKAYLDDYRHLASTADSGASFLRPASFWKSA